MEYICIGKYVSTHGIKGEIKIKSNFNYKEKVFKIGNTLRINNIDYEITSYRQHKGYDMVTFKNITNINQIIDLKGMLVYIKKDLLNLKNNEYLDSDLINYNVYMNDKYLGKVNSIRYITLTKKLLVVDKILIPFELIINIKDKKIYIKEVGGLL